PTDSGTAGGLWIHIGAWVDIWLLGWRHGRLTQELHGDAIMDMCIMNIEDRGLLGGQRIYTYIICRKASTGGLLADSGENRHVVTEELSMASANEQWGPEREKGAMVPSLCTWTREGSKATVGWIGR